MINEYIIWSAPTSKIANKISRTLVIVNKLTRYLPISVMKLMYESLILLHLHFGLTSWGFESNKLFKLQNVLSELLPTSNTTLRIQNLYLKI